MVFSILSILCRYSRRLVELLTPIYNVYTTYLFNCCWIYIVLPNCIFKIPFKYDLLTTEIGINFRKYGLLLQSIKKLKPEIILPTYSRDK